MIWFDTAGPVCAPRLYKVFFISYLPHSYDDISKSVTSHGDYKASKTWLLTFNASSSQIPSAACPKDPELGICRRGLFSLTSEYGCSQDTNAERGIILLRWFIICRQQKFSFHCAKMVNLKNCRSWLQSTLRARQYESDRCKIGWIYFSISQLRILIIM